MTMLTLRRRPSTRSFILLVGCSQGWVCKLRPRTIGENEVRRYRAVCDLLPVPRLLWSGAIGPRALLIFDKVAWVNSSAGLLCDFLTECDGESSIEAARTHARVLIEQIFETGSWRKIETINADLFQTRATRASRLGEWLQLESEKWSGQPIDAPWMINGRLRRRSPMELLLWLEQWAESSCRADCFAIRSQGDATEMNIAVPLCYLDFKYAGDNALLGEIANFAWSVLVQGAYFVPTYNPAAVAGRKRLVKQVIHWQPSLYRSSAGLFLAVPVSSVRRNAVREYMNLMWPRACEIYAAEGRCAAQELLPYLLARILLTFSPRKMAAGDCTRVLALALLADDMGPAAFFKWLGVEGSQNERGCSRDCLEPVGAHSN